MKFFRFPASHTSAAFAHFKRTVQRPMPRARIRQSMDENQAHAFDAVAPLSSYGVWALRLTNARRNVRVWDAIEPGDLAVFYTDQRFTHYAKIVFKWESDSIQAIAPWSPPGDGAYSLAFAVDKLELCDLGATEYCALAGYKRVPVHSDYHGAEKSSELFEALSVRFALVSDEIEDLDPEGRVKYRVQQFRERSDGNRLQVLRRRGAICEVCGFNFAVQYGAQFKPSAQVHHKNPLALGERQAESIEDFAVLCAPCHTAAHMGEGRKLNPWTVEQLRSFIRKRWD